MNRNFRYISGIKIATMFMWMLNMKKTIEFFLYGLVLLLSIISFNCKKSGDFNLIVQACAKSYEARNLVPGHDFFEGHVLVVFKDNIGEAEKIDIINSYGLTVIKIYLFNVVLVKVPQFTEYLWCCKLKLDSRIKSADLNYTIILFTGCQR